MPGGDDDPPAAAAPPPLAPTPAAPQFTPSNLPPVQLSSTTTGRAVGGGNGRSGMSVVAALIVAAVIIGVPVFLVARAGNNAVHDVNNALNQTPFNPPAPSTSSNGSSSPSKPSQPPVGVASGSLMLPAAITSYVTHDLPGNGKLVSLRVAPDNLQAETRTASGGSHHIFVDYAGTKQIVKVGAGGFGSEPTIPLSKIDPNAPSRMVKHIPRHTKSVNYLVLDHDFNGKLQWLAYYKNSNHFYSADAHGRHVHQVS